MPKAKSSVFNKLGSKAKSAFNKHKKDDTRTPGGGSIPEGIDNGIAKITKCEFAEYSKGDNKGQPYFICVATVVAPTKHNGKKVEGLPITWMEPLCSTPKATRKTVDDHIDHMTNFLRLMGLETSELDWDDLEAGCEALVENETEISFRTWKSEPTDQYPNPRVNTTWEGLYEGDEDEDEEPEEDVIIDEEEDDEEPEEIDEEDEEEDEEEDDEEGIDYASLPLTKLAKLADEDDEEAQDLLEGLCEENGLDIEDYKTYKACATALKKAEKEKEEEEEEEEDDYTPEKDDVVFYKPPRARKAREMTVKTVNKRKQTVSLECLETEKKYANIAFDKLSTGD